MMKRLINLLMATALLTATVAHADNSNAGGMNNWRSQDALEQLASDRGWVIRSININGSFYLLRCLDTDGAPIKAYINPLDLTVVDIDSDTDWNTDQQPDSSQ